MADLFPHYPSPPDELIGIAAQLLRASGDTSSTVGDVESGMGRAVDAVDGDISFPMAQAPDPAVRNGTSVAEAAQFASGAVMFFAQAVQTYNDGIDRLNAQVREGEFDVMSLGRAEKLRRLQAEQARLDEALDAAAARVAGMLDRGPNPDDAGFLEDHGYLLSPDGGDVRSIVATMPAGNDPDAMRRWWDSLTLAQQVAIVAARPDLLGNTDGLPAETRDEANRLVMADDYERLKANEVAGTLTDTEAQALANIEKARQNLEAREGHIDPITGAPVHAQLYIYEPYAFDGDGRIAIATGNLDEANHLAVLVPGMGARAESMGSGRSLNVYDESRWASGDSVAVLDWVGYDAPSGSFDGGITGVVNQQMARDGASYLAADVEGLRAARGDDPAHLTVIGNSYGSTTAGIAAAEYDLDADDLILTGSPGVPVGDAGDLTTAHDHTWVGSASRDFVSSLGRTGWTDPTEVFNPFPGQVELLGNDPSEDTFDANRFQAESINRGDDWNIDDHNHYYDKNTESLYNVAAITTGHYDDVTRADPRYDPWYASLRDPERGRTPHEMHHAP
ncbi:MAG TPA: alpha/beta hydrolase [Nocardioidaceae bacterium]|nr:alpha/beta hydrolase [Nocardioidaceae bacterium]